MNMLRVVVVAAIVSVLLVRASAIVPSVEAAGVTTDAGAAAPDAGSTAPPECTVDTAKADLVGPSPDELDAAGLPDFKANTTKSWYGTRSVTDQLYLAIGPDGVVRGTVPATLREDATIVVAVFHPKDRNYEVQITGCDRTTTRLLGTAQSAGSGSGTLTTAERDSARVQYIAELHPLGHCNADKQVSIQVKIADAGCTPKIVISSFQTSPVYSLTVGYGIGFFQGNHSTVGVDIGAGGQANTAYSRQERRGISDRLLLGWFPFGYAPAIDLFENTQGQTAARSILRHAFVGTFVDVSNQRDSLNLNLGLEIVQGLSMFVGLDFCEREQTLGGGLKNGSVFADDSSTLPTTSSFDCKTHPYFGVAATIDLLGKLFPR